MVLGSRVGGKIYTNTHNTQYKLHNMNIVHTPLNIRHSHFLCYIEHSAGNILEYLNNFRLQHHLQNNN